MSDIDSREFESLIINSTTSHSIDSLSLLAAFAIKGGCLPDQYERLTTVLYGHLRSRDLPRFAQSLEEHRTKELHVPISLGVTLPSWRACNEISDLLLQHILRYWQDVRQWIVFLHEEIITRPEVDLEVRALCKASILEYLGLLQHSWVLPWSPQVPADKDLMRVISNLWLLEINNPLFSSWSSTGTQFQRQRDPSIFNSAILIAHKVNIKIDWANVVQVSRNHYDKFAHTAVAHLQYELFQDPPDLECIAWDIHIISALALTANLHLALLKQGSLFICMVVLNFVVLNSWEGDDRKYAARCVVNATVYLKEGLEDFDGAPLVLTFLHMNLIPTLLECEPYLPLVDSDPARHQPGELLGRTLASYTIYRSVLKRVIAIVDRVREASDDRHLQKGSLLYEAW